MTIFKNDFTIIKCDYVHGLSVLGNSTAIISQSDVESCDNFYKRVITTNQTNELFNTFYGVVDKETLAKLVGLFGLQ